MKNAVLSKGELELYDYVISRNIILEIFKLFNYLKITSKEISIPRITSDYRIRYEQFVPVHSSVIKNYTLKHLMFETKCEKTRKELFSKITISLRKLNELELDVFHLAFYENKNEEEIADKLSYGKDKIREIRKSACIKFLTSLGLNSLCLK